MVKRRERTEAFQQRGSGMLWILIAAMFLVVAVLAYCVAMSSEQSHWSRTRRALLGRDRSTGRN
jgi:Tfp pilus assembly protein PilV